jgi:soluble lytic murein transglycosylase-like protein
MVPRRLPASACFVVAGLTVLHPLLARESVCFRTGFCMQADSHTQQGQTFIFQSGGGTMEFPADQISQIVPLPDEPVAQTAKSSGNSPQAVVDSNDLLRHAALDQGLTPEFVRSVARVESGLHQEAVSSKGAIGLMQLMPSTATELGVDPKLAEQNAQGGAKLLRELLLRYGYDPVLALAAYNAGPGAVEKFKGVPPYLETRRYVLRVLHEYNRQQKLESPAP